MTDKSNSWEYYVFNTYNSIQDDMSFSTDRNPEPWYGVNLYKVVWDEVITILDSTTTEDAGVPTIDEVIDFLQDSDVDTVCTWIIRESFYGILEYVWEWPNGTWEYITNEILDTYKISEFEEEWICVRECKFS